MRRKRVLATIIALLLFVAVMNAGEFVQQAINSRYFDVTVQPMDNLSSDVKRADLYVSRRPGSSWMFDGPCKVVAGGDEPQFVRTVSVPSDGVYYYTTRAGDKAGMARVPSKKESPQVKIVVDTTAPVLEMLSPMGGESVQEGNKLNIEWIASDKNFANSPISIYYTANGGVSWKKVKEGVPNTGTYMWRVPKLSGESINLKIEAADIAGNLSREITEKSVKVLSPSIAASKKIETKQVVVEEPKVLAPKVEPEAKVEPAPKVITPPAPIAEKLPVKKALFGQKPVVPETKNPDLDANVKVTDQTAGRMGMTNEKAAYIAYIMAGNLVRQGRYKDSLRYYRTAVDADPKFAEAWSDMALVYKKIRAYTKADACIVKAIEGDKRNPMYIHNRGEIYQAMGLSLLRAQSNEAELARATDCIHFAVKLYGKAIDEAQKKGMLASRAATFFRLGEICYFANQDPVGAREYWVKVMSLHSPTPDLDNVVHDAGTKEIDKTLRVYRHYTERKVSLDAWQSWAQAYLEQLNQLERQMAPQIAPAPGGLTASNTRQTPYHKYTNAAAKTPRVGQTVPAPIYRSKASYAQAGYGSQSGIDPSRTLYRKTKKPVNNSFWNKLLPWKSDSKTGKVPNYGGNGDPDHGFTSYDEK